MFWCLIFKQILPKDLQTLSRAELQEQNKTCYLTCAQRVKPFSSSAVGLPVAGRWKCSSCTQTVPVLHHQCLAGSLPNITKLFCRLGSSSPSTWATHVNQMCYLLPGYFNIVCPQQLISCTAYLLTALLQHQFCHGRSFSGCFFNKIYTLLLFPKKK